MTNACTSDDPRDHQGETCPVHERVRYEERDGIHVVLVDDHVVGTWTTQESAARDLDLHHQRVAGARVIGVPLDHDRERFAVRETREGEATIRYHVNHEAGPFEFVTWKHEGSAGPVWVDDQPYATILYDDGLLGVAWFTRAQARRLAKALGASFGES